MKKNHYFLSLLCLLFVHAASAQVYTTRNGTIRFFSEAPLENIEAINRQVMSALNTKTGEFVFRLPVRSFAFQKALMQEHFNDNFMESHNFPNALFQGKIESIENIDFFSPGSYDVMVSGELTIKDKTQTISEPGTLTIKDGAIQGEAVFVFRLDDYNINIPRRYARNIASEIEVFVNVILRPQ